MMNLRKGGAEFQDAVKPLKRKRARGGHEKTKAALCMSCYDKHKKLGKGKFWLSRYNPSTTRTHVDKVHNGNLVDIFSEDDPRAADAAKDYRRFQG